MHGTSRRTDQEATYPPEYKYFLCGDDVAQQEATRIHPRMIDTTIEWKNAFGSVSMDLAVRKFVKACQRVSNWTVAKFSLDGMSDTNSFPSHRLTGAGLAVDNRDGTFTATPKMIQQCFALYPFGEGHG